MRILHVIETADLAYGGPIEGARRFAEVWARDGHEPDLLTLDAPGEHFLNDYPGKIFSVGPKRGRSPLKRYRYAPKMIPWLRQHAGEYDVVIVSGLWRYMARGAFKALVGEKTPYFAYTHGMLDPWFRKTAPLKNIGKQLSWWWAEGPLLRNAAAVLFTAEEEKRLAENAFWPYRVNPEVVNYGAPDIEGDPAAQKAAFHAMVPSVAGRRYMLFLSRIHPKKGCDLLLEAFAKIAHLHHDLDLVVAGPDQAGLVPGFKERVASLDLQNRVVFPGMLRGDAKIGAFRNAEAFILPSHQENFGIVVAEALSAGTPVLISDKINIWREIEAAGAGFVEPDTLEGALALLDSYLALSSSEREVMRERARKCFTSQFRVEEAARSLVLTMKSYIAPS